MWTRVFTSCLRGQLLQELYVELDAAEQGCVFLSSQQLGVHVLIGFQQLLVLIAVRHTGKLVRREHCAEEIRLVQCSLFPGNQILPVLILFFAKYAVTFSIIVHARHVQQLLVLPGCPTKLLFNALQMIHVYVFINKLFIVMRSFSIPLVWVSYVSSVRWYRNVTDQWSIGHLSYFTARRFLLLFVWARKYNTSSLYCSHCFHIMA